MRLSFPLIICFLSLLASCQQNKKSVSNGVFFNHSFLEGQISLLDSLQPSINKTVLFNDSSEAISQKKVEWSKELAIFQEATLDKPILATAFETSTKDSAGLQITTHTRKPDGLGTIVWAKETVDANQTPVQFEAVLVDSNTLYISKKHLKAIFTNNKLKSYEQVVDHHIPVGEDAFYKVDGDINW